LLTEGTKSLKFIVMKLTDAYNKYKIENTITFQFKNEFKEVSILEVTKLKSGYEVVYNSENQNFYNRIDGLKDMNSVKKHIENFKF
jgi:hypothetical protein